VCTEIKEMNILNTHMSAMSFDKSCSSIRFIVLLCKKKLKKLKFRILDVILQTLIYIYNIISFLMLTAVCVCVCVVCVILYFHVLTNMMLPTI
jgi:hypothetical protein